MPSRLPGNALFFDRSLIFSPSERDLFMTSLWDRFFFSFPRPLVPEPAGIGYCSVTEYRCFVAFVFPCCAAMNVFARSTAGSSAFMGRGDRDTRYETDGRPVHLESGGKKVRGYDTPRGRGGYLRQDASISREKRFWPVQALLFCISCMKWICGLPITPA